MKLTPPPRRDDPRFDDWVTRLFQAFQALESAPAPDAQFISQAKAVDLTDGGDTTLHYHAVDRARANHTGTQLAATISDLDTVIANSVSIAIGGSSATDILSTQVFGS